MTPPRPIVYLQEITARIRDRWILHGTTWKILSGENWVILGPNGSGKTTLAKVLTGEIACVAGRVVRSGPGPDAPLSIGHVSFDLAQKTIDADRERDWARLLGHAPDRIATVGDLLKNARGSFPDADPVIEALWDRPIRGLSNGELRKVLIAGALAGDPDLLVLDEPFDGLDRESRTRLKCQLSHIIGRGRQVVLVTHRYEELLPEITHGICLQDGRVVYQGTLSEVLSWKAPHPFPESEKTRELIEAPKASPMKPSAVPFIGPIIDMRNVSVSHGNQKIIDNLTWTVQPGEHWAVTGPNGSGKTTLMRLVWADHPQGYAKDIRLFGKPRGSGESIWEIKRHIGIVSAEFQMRYHRSVTAMDTVISGFFDSVGVYQRHSREQSDAARYWMDRLGIRRLAETPMDRLSHGEKRLVLLARALVKSPRLLILDEPCQGLDPDNRELLLGLIDQIFGRILGQFMGHMGGVFQTQMIYVTHHPMEIPTCATHRLSLGDPYSNSLSS